MRRAATPGSTHSRTHSLHRLACDPNVLLAQATDASSPKWITRAARSMHLVISGGENLVRMSLAPAALALSVLMVLSSEVCSST
jgi:hypothetical protein